MYSELDEKRWEIRKVEFFDDGTVGYADRHNTAGGTMLGEQPIPPFEQIAKNSEFEPSLISKQEFETIWSEVIDGVTH